MKHISKITVSLLLTVALVVGCNTDELKDLDKNPQAVGEIDMNFFFTAAQLGAASGGSKGDNRYVDWRTNIGLCSHAIQQLAHAGGSGIAPGDKYTENFESSNAPFEFSYDDQLKHIAEILKVTGPGGYDEGNKVNMRNAARILRAFIFHRLTDYYGNVPYFEANKAADRVFFPVYDTQQAIYTDLLKELEEATAQLSPSNPDDGFAAADLYYGGDATKWKKWGYSIMLRLAMRVSNVDQAMTNSYVAKAVAGGPFTSNGDNVWVPMDLGPSEWTNQNGISRAFYPGDGGQGSYLSERLVNWLKGTDLNSTADDDPRLMIFTSGIGEWTPTSWTPTNVDPLEQKGLPNGHDASTLAIYEGVPGPVDQAATYSRVNVRMLDDDDPYMLMNYGEVEFLLAEAAERSLGGLSPGDAQAHYEAGVRASMQMYAPYDASLTVSDAAVDTYLANYPYTGTTDQKLEMIGEQMWANKFLNWWEAWSDWRRTGYPVLTPINYPGNITGGTIPRKLKIPGREVSSNSTNFEAGATLPNEYTTRVWWDGGN